MRRTTLAAGILASTALVLAALAGGCNAILGNEEKSLASSGPDSSVADVGTDLGVDTARFDVVDSGGADETLSDATDATDSRDADDVADSPTCSDAGTGGPAATLCAGKIVYVSPTGADEADGCDPCRPKRSIASALRDLASAAAADAGDAGVAALTGFELRVCVGATPYVESRLTLEIPVSIKGGWDCKTFTRLSGFGAPTFDPATESTIDDATPDAQRDTLVVQGSAIDRSVVIEGIRVLAPASGSRSSAAIVVDGGARPTITDSVFVGRATSRTDRPFGSAGMLVQGAAAPDVVHCRIEGGAGSGTGAYGSVGVQGIGPGDAIFRDDVITGGSGTGTYGSTGMSFAGGGAVTLVRSLVDGGSGDGVVTGVYGTSPIDMSSNVIRGSLGTSATVTGGVIANAGTLTRNRIFAGSGASTATRFGVQISGGPRLANNMIHGGANGTT
jgi:hypothetical protein